MATSAGTEPADVKVETDTVLKNTKISSLLERIEREIDRAYDDDPSVTFDDTQHRVDFEATLTALRIAEGLDRRAESVTSGRSSRTFDTAEIDNLRQRVRSLDPGDEFGQPSSVIWDSDRHISSSGGNS